MFILSSATEEGISELKDFVSTTINDAVNFWLPYITITELNIVTGEDDPTLVHNLKISIRFTVTGSNSEETITIFAGQDGILRIE